MTIPPPRSRPVPMNVLRPRQLDGAYPFRTHRTCAEWMTFAPAPRPAAFHIPDARSRRSGPMKGGFE